MYKKLVAVTARVKSLSIPISTLTGVAIEIKGSSPSLTVFQSIGERELGSNEFYWVLGYPIATKDAGCVQA